MATTFKILLTRQSDGAEEVCAGEISGEDWKLFASFRDFAKDLESAEWVATGLHTGYSARPDEAGVMRVNATNKPSDAVVRELLHLLRPFTLKSEPTWYPAVNSRLRRYLEHPFLRNWLADGRRVFDNGRFHLYGQITINDLPLHDDRTFMLWLNAFEYHRDPEKRAALEAVFRGPPDEFALAAFRSIVADRAAEVLRLGLFITNMERGGASA